MHFMLTAHLILKIILKINLNIFLMEYILMVH
jgi:hypothetical protein